MDQPLYNPNAINENFNNDFSENQYQKPTQSQDNQLYMMPPDMNAPPQEEQNPNLDMIPPIEQPYYSPPNPIQNSYNPEQNQQIPSQSPVYPINPQQNQPIPSQSPVYYSPPEYAQNPQPQPQPFSQGVPLVQQIQNYPTQNNNIYVQSQGMPDYNYQNYQNISQIRHQGISQKNQNTFKISPGDRFYLSVCCMFFGIFCFIFGIISFLFFYSNVTYCVVGLIFFIIGLSFSNNKKFYFIMGPNNLTVINKECCNKRVNVYNPGQLQRVEFIDNYTINNMGNSNNVHNYIINIVTSNGEVINIYNKTANNIEFTPEEIGYFLNCINNHIQNNMRA